MTTMTQDLAQKYVQKMATLLDECAELERNAPHAERKELYRKNQMRIDRTIDNYFKKRDPDTPTDDDLHALLEE